MPRQPLVEVFGFPIEDQSAEAVRHRRDRLCPFNNKVPSCTKDKIENPLGVCSIYEGDVPTVICPVRFRERWRIVSDAASFIFPSATKWTTLTEVRLKDSNGKSAGNIDVVLVAYDDDEVVTDFGSLEIQGVYISGNLTKPFRHYMQDPEHRADMEWRGQKNYPHADYLSSSRKRLAPQLIYKGGIFNYWGKKMTVAIDRPFFGQLPQLPQVEKAEADLAWMVYELRRNQQTALYQLELCETIYTKFAPVLDRITRSNPGTPEDFIRVLQKKLTAKLAMNSPNGPDADIEEVFGSADPIE